MSFWKKKRNGRDVCANVRFGRLSLKHVHLAVMCQVSTFIMGKCNMFEDIWKMLFSSS